MPQGSLQGRPHLHLAEFIDGEVEVIDGGVALVRVVLQQKLSQVEANQGDLGAEADLFANFESLFVVAAGFVQLAQEIRDRVKLAPVWVRAFAFPAMVLAVRLEAAGLTWGREQALFAVAVRERP